MSFEFVGDIRQLEKRIGVDVCFSSEYLECLN